MQVHTPAAGPPSCTHGGPVVQWLVQRFRSERLRVRSRRSATFTPSAHVRRQSLPVWPPTLNNYLYLYLFLLWRPAKAETVSCCQWLAAHGRDNKLLKGVSHMSRDGFYGIDQSATCAQGLENTMRARW